MNINQIKLLSKINPNLRLIIKRIITSLNKPLNFILMGNPNFSGKIFSLLNSRCCYYLNPNELKSTILDDQGLPIPPSEYIVGLPSKEWYLKSGKDDFEQIIQLLKKSDEELTDNSRILDFGCSNGRIIRWFYNWTKQGEVWGVDISAEQILWAKTNLSPPFKFVTTTTNPHLPFEDNYFDFIYATSVFTHIDDLADFWLLELRRILKQDGLLFVTIQDETSVEHLKLQQSIDKYAKTIFNTKECKKFYENRRGIFCIGRSVYTQIYYELDYFIKYIKNYFDIVAIQKNSYRDYQTGILLKKVKKADYY